MNVNEGLWSARMPNGDIRAGTLEQLDEAFRAGHLGAKTLVCASRSDRWINLADVLGGAAARTASTAVDLPGASVPTPSASGAPESAGTNGRPEQARRAEGGHASVAPPSAPAPERSPGGDELWQARLPDGQVRSGTRQQLEEAFRAGYLPEGTLVLAAGALEWETLAAVGARRLSQPVPLPIVAPEPAPVETQLATPAVALQETPVAALEQAPAAEQAPAIESSPLRTADEQPNLPATWDEDQTWRVDLTSQRLELIFNAGLLDDQALVLAVGTDEWRRLGDVMRSRSDPAMTPPPLEPSGEDAAATNGAHAKVDAPKPVPQAEPSSPVAAASDRGGVDS